MPTPPMTEPEIISYLRKTSLPTILVEGDDDAIIYRWLEKKLGIFSGNVLVCSGKQVLFSLYQKRVTLGDGKFVWLADLDMGCFTGRPAGYDDVVFTSGYSLENDLYAGSAIEDLLDETERFEHSKLLRVVCRWFSFEVLEHLAGRRLEVKNHIRETWGVFPSRGHAAITLGACSD